MYVGMTPLMIAIIKNRPDMVKFLLESGAPTDKRSLGDNTAMEIAIRYHDREEIIELLLQFGADPNFPCTPFSTPLFSACSKNMYKYIPILVKAGARINETVNKRTALHTAAWNNNIESVRLLIEAGADLKLFCGYWGTALDDAIQNKSKEAAEILIQAGAIKMR